MFIIHETSNWKRETNRNDEPEIERGLFGLEDVEDVGGVPRKLVESNPNLLLRILHRYVNGRHWFRNKDSNQLWSVEP